MKTIGAVMAAAALLWAQGASAQAPPATPVPGAPPMPASPPQLTYGPSLDLAQARTVVAAAEAEAARRKVQVTMAIVDTAGQLIYFQKAPNGPNSAEEYALRKARSSARTRYPTSYDAARYAAGVTALAMVDAVFPFGGGQPITAQGKVVGAIGVSGGFDDDVAKAGAKALETP